MGKYGVFVLIRSLFILLVFIITLSASPLQTERKIYQTILHALFPQKKIVYVWLDDKSREGVFEHIPGVKVVSYQTDADILIIKKSYDINVRNKIIFADGYLVYKQQKHNIIGGFYWQKGRPNLVFIKKNLQKEGIKLPQDLQEYIEEDTF